MSGAAVVVRVAGRGRAVVSWLLLSGALLVWGFPPMVLAQDASEVLSRGNRAYAQGNFQEAAKLLSYVLNPELRLPDSVWVPALHRLAHSLLEIGRGDLAGVWLRWALRHRGPITVDDVNFPPAVVSAFGEASRRVASGRGPDTLTFVRTKWKWPEKPQEVFTLGGLSPASGLLGIPETKGYCPQPQLSLALGRLASLGPLSPRQVRYLPPETYGIERTGANCQEAWLEREVLPGVVTELEQQGLLTVFVTVYSWLFVYLDGDLVGVAQRRGHAPLLQAFVLDGKQVPPAEKLPVDAGTHRIELRYETGGAVALDTSVVVPGGSHVVLNLKVDARRGPDDP